MPFLQARNYDQQEQAFILELERKLLVAGQITAEAVREAAPRSSGRLKASVRAILARDRSGLRLKIIANTEYAYSVELLGKPFLRPKIPILIAQLRKLSNA